VIDTGPEARTRVEVKETAEAAILDVQREEIRREQGPPRQRESYTLTAPATAPQAGAWELVFRTDRARFVHADLYDAPAAIPEAVWVRGQPTSVIAPGLTAWSLPIDQLGAGAQYYQYNPLEARRLLADAGFATGVQTTLYATSGFGAGTDHLDAVQLIQRFLKDVGMTAELKLQEFGAYVATTAQGKFEGLAYGLVPLAWNPDRPFYTAYIQRNNMSHVNDPTLTAMFTAQRRTQDVETRKNIVFDMQRYAAEQQYYVYLIAGTSTASWQPYVQNYAPNSTFDYGGRAAALWLDR